MRADCPGCVSNQLRAGAHTALCRRTASARECDVLDLGQAFGLELRAVRKEKKLTIRQAAELVGIARRNFSRAEGGYHTPRLEMVVRAAEVFGLEPAVFFGRIIDRARLLARVVARVEGDAP
jgi:DNA-binding XRE family transcriptional regulator